MKDLVIVGAGDFAREAIWVAERMNQQYPQWNILGYVDDDEQKTGRTIDEYPVLGTTEWLVTCKREIHVTCAIGNGKIRRAIWEKLHTGNHIIPATLIDPSVVVGKNVIVEEGCIVCAGTVLAIASKLYFNSIINLNCTIGHDAVLEEYCTVHPGTNISGKVVVGACTDIGTGSKIIQGIQIASGSILGAGTVVTKNLEVQGTYVGVPARRIK